MVYSLRIPDLHLRNTSQHSMGHTSPLWKLRSAMADLLKNEMPFRILPQIGFPKDPFIIGFVSVQISRQKNVFCVPAIKHYEISIPHSS